MAHLQNWFGLLPPDIATILPWSESLDKPLAVMLCGWGVKEGMAREGWRVKLCVIPLLSRTASERFSNGFIPGEIHVSVLLYSYSQSRLQ